MQPGSHSFSEQVSNNRSQSLSALDAAAARPSSGELHTPLALTHQQRRLSEEAVGSLLAAARSSSSTSATRSLSAGSSGLVMEASSLGNSLSNGNTSGSQSIALASIGEETARLARMAPLSSGEQQQTGDVQQQARGEQHCAQTTLPQPEGLLQEGAPSDEHTHQLRQTQTPSGQSSGRRHHTSHYHQHKHLLQQQQQQARGLWGTSPQQYMPYWAQPVSAYSPQLPPQQQLLLQEPQQQGAPSYFLPSGSVQQQVVGVRSAPMLAPYMPAQQQPYHNATVLASNGGTQPPHTRQPLLQEHYAPISSGVAGYAGLRGGSYLMASTPLLPLPSALTSVPHPPVARLPSGGDDTVSLADQIRLRDSQIGKLAGTLAHYRAWSVQVQARYHMYNPEAARPARRVYFGGLPPDTQELELRQYVNDILVKIGGSIAPGLPINSCKLYPEKSFAFLEFRSVEEASNCMAFDGISFRDHYLKVRRPNNYNAELCSMLGPSEPDPTMDLSGLDVVKTVVDDSPNKLFVGGLPCDWAEDQAKEMLLPFGTLKAFNLVMDKVTGNSKGYCFVEFADASATNYVVQVLNGKPIGSKFLTVKRAVLQGPIQLPFDQAATSASALL